MKVLDLDQVDSVQNWEPSSPQNVMRQIQSRVLSAMDIEVAKYLEDDPKIQERLVDMNVSQDDLKKAALIDVSSDMDRKSRLYGQLMKTHERGADLVVEFIQLDIHDKIANAAKILLLNAQAEELSEKVTQDALTGLLNKQMFYEICANAIATLKRTRSGEEPSKLRAFVMDLDGFKQVNDIHGHLVGDQILIQFAKRLKVVMPRESDVLARFGGDEFLALLPNTNKAGAEMVANKILTAVNSKPFIVTDQNGVKLEINLTVSVGGGEYNWESDYIPMLDRADEALYKAKNGGRNRAEIN